MQLSSSAAGSESQRIWQQHVRLPAQQLPAHKAKSPKQLGQHLRVPAQAQSRQRRQGCSFELCIRQHVCSFTIELLMKQPLRVRAGVVIVSCSDAPGLETPEHEVLCILGRIRQRPRAPGAQMSSRMIPAQDHISRVLALPGWSKGESKAPPFEGFVPPPSDSRWSFILLLRARSSAVNRNGRRLCRGICVIIGIVALAAGRRAGRARG